MDATTRRLLNELNRRFYRENADAFDVTRRVPWPGWNRLAEFLPATGPLSTLDLGCGNGRFLRWLAEALEQPLLLLLDE